MMFIKIIYYITPLHIATRNSFPAVNDSLVKFLTPLYEKSKAKIDIYNNNGHTPLQNFIDQCYPRYDSDKQTLETIMQTLFNLRADPGAKVGGAEGTMDLIALEASLQELP